MAHGVANQCSEPSAIPLGYPGTRKMDLSSVSFLHCGSIAKLRPNGCATASVTRLDDLKEDIGNTFSYTSCLNVCWLFWKTSLWAKTALVNFYATFEKLGTFYFNIWSHCPQLTSIFTEYESSVVIFYHFVHLVRGRCGQSYKFTTILIYDSIE